MLLFELRLFSAEIRQSSKTVLPTNLLTEVTHSNPLRFGFTLENDVKRFEISEDCIRKRA
jgi:hypothetical protein